MTEHDAAKDAVFGAARKVIAIRDWNHDEDHKARREYDRAADELKAALDAAPADDAVWRSDRPGWYWGRWPGLDWTPCLYLGVFGELELWDGGGRPSVVGIRIAPPPAPRDEGEGDG